jgi:hypothetical protein
MAKFLFVYRNRADAYYKSAPEEMQAMHQKWQAWVSEGLSKGWMLETGVGLRGEGRIVNAEKVISDGPFIEIKEVVGGFTTVEADSLDAAAELAKGCPVLLGGGSVEVRPVWG